MSYSNHNPEWGRMIAGLHDAQDQQPWRCVVCHEAVSLIRHNDCACTRAARAERKPAEP